MFKCADCGRQFVSSKIPDSETIIREYIEDKLTLRQISARHGICIKTVWNKLKDMHHVHVISKDRDVVINMDTTYWGRGFGLMIIKDTFRNKILWYKFVRNETVAGYCKGIDWLRSEGFTIYGIVCDGMRGLFRELRQNHTVELTEEEKEQARQDAINKLRDEEMAKIRRPKTTEKKAPEVQPSLFDF